MALLALHPQRPLAREKVCGLLWPDVREEQARHSLRQTLLTVRKTMTDALVRDERHLSLDLSRVGVDVAQLQEHLEDGSRDALAAAANLYRGDLLDGMALTEHPFEQWLRFERERVRAAMARGLTRLVELHSEAGLVADAVTACTRLLQLDPLNEDAHRVLMRLQVRQRRRASALQTYQTFARRLKAELGVEPEPETRQLYVELEAASSGGDPSRAAASLVEPIAASGIPHARVAPEVTRAQELEDLQRAYAAARSGGPSGCLLLGEEGVGKTHLCDRFAREAAAKGTRVLHGHCFESEQVLPFSLWANLMASANLAAEAKLLAEIPAESRAELARLIPDLEPAPPPRASAEAVQLFRAVEALLLQFGKSTQLVLILEDLHWADEMSLRLLCFLTRRRFGFWVGTARREQISSDSFLRKAVAELDRERRLHHLAVEPFTREQTEELAGQWARHLKLEVQSDLWAEQVWTLSEGNALVIVESARSCAEGAFVDRLERLPVPERVRVMIHGRVQRLRPAARELLALATVHDGELPLRAVDEMFEPVQLAEAAEELTEHQLMRANGESLGFTHVRIRETLYEEMLPLRRRLLHARTAAALERQSGLHSTGWLGRVGYHYLRAGEVESAIDYLVRFAEQARRGHALGEALAALERAAQASEQLPAAKRFETLIDLLIRQAFCLAFLGRFSDLVARLSEAEARVEALGRADLASQFHFWWGFGLTLIGEPGAAEEHGNRALQHASRCDDGRNLGYAHGLLSYLCGVTGRFAEGLRHGKVAVDVFWDATDVPEARVIAVANLGLSHLGSGDWQSALASAQLAASAAQADDSQRGRSLAASLEASAYLITEQSDMALPAAVRAVEASNTPFTSAVSYFMLASAQARMGQTEPAIGVLQHIASELEKHGIRTFMGLTLEGLADAQLRAGDPSSALASAARSVESARSMSDPVVLGRALRTHGRAEQAMGRKAPARSDLNEARALFEGVGARLELAHTYLALAELELARHDEAAAAENMRRGCELFRELGADAAVEAYAARASVSATL